MKPGSLLKRVASREPRGRSKGGKESKAENCSFSDPLINKYEAVKTPTRKQNYPETKSRKPEKGGGSLFKRMINRKKAKDAPIEPPPQVLAKPERRTLSSTPLTIDTDMGAEIEVHLGIPCERVPSYAETTLTHEISDFSAQMDEACEKPNKKPLERSSSASRGPSQRTLILGTSAVPFGSSRSLRNFRTSGNESLGEAKPDQPRRGFLPPLLADGEESIGESSCSGITMDFTYGEEMKTPMRQPVGRLGEGVRQSAPTWFVPPSYITTDDLDDMDEDDLDRPLFGDF